MMKATLYTSIFFAFLLFLTPLKSQTYCPAKGTLPWENWIERVSLAPANFSNPSVKEGYGNFTALTGMTAQRGSVNLLTISPRASWNNDPRNANIFWRVWIDYNGDGDFTDADEQAISRQVVFTNGLFLDNETTFRVPTTARLGNTRLRVAMKVGDYPSPCETYERGEVEDYTINITDGSTTSCRYQDSLQLVSLYNATNPATWLHKWNLNTPLNTWYGVSLNAEGCVVSVNLENNTMVGANLPTLNMPNLEFLNLRNNVLSGTIPNVNCPKLTGLLLAANQFTGTIPNYNCPNMQNLFLYGNQLTGTIPPFNYPNIVKLLLDGNQLTGTIPSFNAPFMNHFAVSFNRLTGSIPNFNFPVIDKLFIDNNQLSGCIPMSFKAFCGKNVNISNNPSLATQDFTAFCSNNTGACNQNLPDLTLANLTIPTPSVQQGKILNFKIDIKNIGTGNATANFNVKAYISTDNVLSANDVQDGIIPTGNFIAGFSVLQVPGASTIPATLPVGQYYLILKVDADNQITESNENNNVIVSTTTFTITGQTGSAYCLAKGTSPWQQWLERVWVQSNAGTYSFPATVKEGYGNFTNAPPVNMYRGQGQGGLISIAPNSSWVRDPLNNNMFWRVWIDLNNDNDFDDAGELIISDKVFVWIDVFMDNDRPFTIPATANLGRTRMRVAMKVGGYPTPCETFERGEVEDYSVNIINPPAATQPLIAFGNLKAELVEATIRLDWVKYSDKITAFTIEKSLDGQTFQFMQKVAIMPFETYYYGYDTAPTEGGNFYRLKMTLNNGEVVYSNSQYVLYQKLPDFTLFPNPSSEEVFVDLKAFENTTVQLSISNVIGKIVAHETIESAHRAPHRLDISTLESGAYFIRIETKGKRVVVRKLEIMK